MVKLVKFIDSLTDTLVAVNPEQVVLVGEVITEDSIDPEIRILLSVGAIVNINMTLAEAVEKLSRS